MRGGEDRVKTAMIGTANFIIHLTVVLVQAEHLYSASSSAQYVAPEGIRTQDLPFPRLALDHSATHPASA